MPQRHYCDITGLEVIHHLCSRSLVTDCNLLQAPYTDPATGLRYHDKSVYELIKGLVSISLDFDVLWFNSSDRHIYRVQVLLKTIYPHGV